jgi:hypothetical protein
MMAIMFNKFLCVLFLGLSLVSVQAQTGTCDLELAESPRVNGFELGLSKNDVMLLKNDIQVGNPAAVDRKRIGYTTNYKAAFLGDKVIAFEITFDDGVEYEGATALAQVVSHRLKLPVDAWLFDKTNARRATMPCKGFEVRIDSGANKISLTDIR